MRLPGDALDRCRRRVRRDRHARLDAEEASRRRAGLLRTPGHVQRTDRGRQRTDRGRQRTARTPRRLRPRIPQPHARGLRPT
ncbi:hypothetical protein [Streptomyces sp. NPDC051677]|uniref:hypothetical protein n=1 Tax=Streptomyces sp. NPDC051677 TaxID=3365669 RepID=UPI0037CD5E7A